MNTGRILAAACAFLALLALASFLVFNWHPGQNRERELRVEASRVQVMPALVSWSTNTTGWEAPMTARAQLAGIAGLGVTAASESNKLRVAFKRIVIEKNPGAPEVQITGLAATYSYTDRGGARRNAPTAVSGGTSSQRFEGRLTDDAPVLVIEGREFVFSTAGACPRPGCRYGLEVAAKPVRRPGP